MGNQQAKKSTDSVLEAIKSAFLVGIAGWLINMLLAYIIDIILIFAIIPQISALFPAIKEALRALSIDTSTSENFSDLLFEAAMLVSCFPAFIVSYRFHKGRKEKFLRETKGFITRKQGIVYHFKNHWASEAAIFICLLVISLATELFSPSGIFKDLLGNAISFPFTMIIILSAQLLGILFSQSRWRALQFIGEE